MTLAAVAAPTAAASAASTAKLWQNKAHTVTCGIEIHAPGKPATDLLCSAKGLPPVKHGVGDPFVQIARSGRAQVVPISQYSWVSHKTATLKSGSTWSSLGVRCTLAGKLVTCKNASKHGFTVGNGKYKSF